VKIAIDISQIVYGTGVSFYTRKLVENLLKIDSTDEYILFAGSFRRKGEILNFFPQTKIFPIPPTMADFIWNRLHIMPIEKLIGNIDVLHTSDWTEPPSKAFKVTTVHDLIPFKFPRLIHKKVLEAHLRRLKWVQKESDRIIVPSNSTKTDLISFGVQEEKIRVIPEAGVVTRVNRGSVDEVKRKYKITGDYLVAFGSAPYKNIARIVKAFELSSAGKNLKLVIIGNQSVPLVEAQRNIRLAGYVADDELAVLMAGSKGLVYASIYEGFGQNILEGFAYGIPVVTSNVASMPEVAGDAAILVDPYSVRSISEGIEMMLRGPKSYIEKGYKQVEKFSWERTAKLTLEVYKEAGK
jgi:glycosyltransferase involved in cell wall biosynthesis